MESLDRLATCAETVLICCMCESLLRDPVMLSCLHNCCRLCFDKAASQSTAKDVACGTCGETTQAGAQQLNVLIDNEVWLYRIMCESKICDVCEGLNLEREAQSCCPVCRLLLCGGCSAYHAKFHKDHHEVLIENLESVEVYPQSLVTSCAIHNKPLDISCLSCMKAKCVVCWVQCNQLMHKMLVVGEDSFDKYAGNLAKDMTSMANDLLGKLKALKKPERVLNELKESRANRLKQIEQRKLLIIQTVDSVYMEIENATKEAYDDLEKEASGAILRAVQIQSGVNTAESYIRKLVQSKSESMIVGQYKAVRDCLDRLSAAIERLTFTQASIGTSSEINSSLPADLKHLVGEWIGKPPTLPAVVPSPQILSFGASSTTVQLPFDCWDVSLTTDERLLLAAGKHGLVEFCSSGRKLSSWPSPSWNNVEPDYVQSVAALIDGRAAVAVYQSKLIMVLRRNENDGSDEASGDQWIVDRQLEQMPFSPGCLSVHGDVLAVSELSGDRLLHKVGELSMTQPLGERLQLMSVSSKQRLSYELRLGYQIASLTVTSQRIVTASSHKVEQFQFPMAYVIDARSLINSNERLWRYTMSGLDNERVLGVCADSTDSVLYVAVCCISGSSRTRVTILSMANGRELRSIPMTFDVPLMPIRMSLTDIAATEQQGSNESGHFCIAATLCDHRPTKEYRVVTIHRSS